MSAGFENATTKSAEVNGAPGRSSRHISSSLDRGAGSGRKTGRGRLHTLVVGSGCAAWPSNAGKNPDSHAGTRGARAV